MPSVRCPGCEAALKLKAAPPAGKKLRCPKCGAAFAPKVTRAAEPAGESWDDWEDPAAPAPPPNPRARRAAGGSRKRAAADSGGVPRAVWIGLATTVAAVLVGLGVYLAVFSGEAADVRAGGIVVGDGLKNRNADDGGADPPDPAASAPGAAGSGGAGAVAESGPAPEPSGPLRPPAPAPFPTAYLPPDADVFVHVRVADLWNDPLLAAATPTQARLLIPTTLGPFGIDVAGVESVTLGGPILAEFRGAMSSAGDVRAGAAAGRRLAEETFPKFLSVVRLADPYEPTLTTPDGRSLAPEARDFAGQRLFDVPSTPQFQDVSLWMPDDRTVVLGMRPAVEAAAGRGGAAVERPGFAGVGEGDAVVVAFAAGDGLLGLPTEADTRRRDPGFPPPTREGEQASATWGVARRRAAGAALGVSVGGPPVWTLTLPARAEGAGDAEALADSLRDLLKTLIETADPRGPATPAWKLLVLDTLEAGAVEVAADAARLTLPMPADLRSRFAALAGGGTPADDSQDPDAPADGPAGIAPGAAPPPVY